MERGGDVVAGGTFRSTGCGRGLGLDPGGIEQRRHRVDRRGESVDAENAVHHAAPHVGFREARRRLFRVRTLRRSWAGGFLLGVALIAYGQLLSLFFEETFAFGPFERGVIQFLVGAGTVAGILVGARAGSVAAASGDFGRLAHVTAGSFLVCAAALVGLAVIPWAPVAAAMTFFLGIGLGAYQPVFFPLVARIVDPQVRSQAYGWSLVCVGMGPCWPSRSPASASSTATAAPSPFSPGSSPSAP